MLTAFLWGLAPVFDKIGLDKASPIVALTIRTLVMTIGIGTFSLASGTWRDVLALESRSFLFLVLAAVSAGLIGQLVYYYALKTGEPGKVVPLVATYPLISLLISVIYLREPISTGKVAGAVLIVLGVLLIGLEQTS